MSRKKRILIIGAAIAAAAVTATLLLLLSPPPPPPQPEMVTIERVGDGPMLVYNKFGEYSDGRMHYDVMLCEFGAAPQKVLDDAHLNSFGANGKAFSYRKIGNDWKKDIYLFTSCGANVLCAKLSSLSLFSKDQYKLLLWHGDDLKKDDLLEYTPDGQFVSNEIIHTGFCGGIEGNNDFSIFFYEKYKQIGNDNERPDVYMYYDGKSELVAENSWVSRMKGSIANDGSVLYISDYDEQTETGALYMKEWQQPAEKIVDGVTEYFSISGEGRLIAVRKIMPDGEPAMIYRFDDGALVEVENVKQFILSTDGAALYYIVEADGAKQGGLYMARKGEAPVLVDEKAVWIVECSDDGEAVAYMSNYENERLGELYVARNGTEIEFIDSKVQYEGMFRPMMWASVNMYRDGSAIAYWKDSGDEVIYDYEDLYLKRQGEAAQLVDEDAGIIFDFIE